MTFEEWYAGEYGEPARKMKKLLIGQVEDSIKIMELTVKMAYTSGIKEGIEQVKGIINDN